MALHRVEKTLLSSLTTSSCCLLNRIYTQELLRSKAVNRNVVYVHQSDGVCFLGTPEDFKIGGLSDIYFKLRSENFNTERYKRYNFFYSL